jgi:hypothetical protein
MAHFHTDGIAHDDAVAASRPDAVAHTEPNDSEPNIFADARANSRPYIASSFYLAPNSAAPGPRY